MTTPNTRRRRRVQQRYTRLVALGFRSYREYLRSGHWAGVKARYRASDEPQDCICGETERVHLHHLTYERIGAEELYDLTPLCPPCHAMIHELERRGEMGLDFAGLVDQERAKRNEPVLRDVERRFAQEKRAECEPLFDALETFRRAAEEFRERHPSMRRVVSTTVSRVNAFEKDLLRRLPT